MQHAHISLARYVSSRASGMKFGQIARSDHPSSTPNTVFPVF